jgi:hypothetical protein
MQNSRFYLSCSCFPLRYEELERLLKRDTLKNAPVIIYVNFKNQAEELAKYLYNKCHIHAEWFASLFVMQHLRRGVGFCLLINYY